MASINGLKVFCLDTAAEVAETQASTGFTAGTVITIVEANPGLRNCSIGQYALYEILANSPKRIKNTVDPSFSISSETTANDLGGWNGLVFTGEVAKIDAAISNYIYNTVVNKAELVQDGNDWKTAKTVKVDNATNSDYLTLFNIDSADLLYLDGTWTDLATKSFDFKTTNNITVGPTSNQITIPSGSLGHWHSDANNHNISVSYIASNGQTNSFMWTSGTTLVNIYPRMSYAIDIATSAPNATYGGPGMKICLLDSEPSTRYSGWLYFIKG